MAAGANKDLYIFIWILNVSQFVTTLLIIAFYSALVTTLRRASLYGAVDRLAFFAILAIFWRFFWPILILGQFVITPYSNIF